MYGWLAHYFKTHYPLANGPTDPFMASYFGNGAARYYEKKDTRKHIHRGASIVGMQQWSIGLICTTATMMVMKRSLTRLYE